MKEHPCSTPVDELCLFYFSPSSQVELDTENGGKLVVFANYPYVHRVAPMKNTSDSEPASRDFVLLFIVDPAHPLEVTARSFLDQSASSPAPAVSHRTDAENPNDDEEDEKEKELRMALLRQQMAPAGRFGFSGIAASGNGCWAMLGWLERQ